MRRIKINASRRPRERPGRSENGFQEKLPLSARKPAVFCARCRYEAFFTQPGPVPALGPAGAGWGLVIPFGVGSLIMIAYLRSSRSIIRLNFFGLAPRWALFADILKVGVPGLINTAITNLSVVVLTGIAGQFG